MVVSGRMTIKSQFALGHLHLRSLIRSHRSLIRLLCTARFAHSLAPELMGKLFWNLVRCERTSEWTSEWPSTLRVDLIVIQPTVHCADSPPSMMKWRKMPRQKNGFQDWTRKGGLAKGGFWGEAEKDGSDWGLGLLYFRFVLLFIEQRKMEVIEDWGCRIFFCPIVHWSSNGKDDDWARAYSLDAFSAAVVGSKEAANLIGFSRFPTSGDINNACSK